jgi:hypothetical protein
MYNVIYDDLELGISKVYLAHNVGTYLEAVKQLHRFEELYMDGAGGKEYPNKKGFYPFRNPRVVSDRNDGRGLR